MTLEQLDEAFPRLIPGLVAHPGISLALVHSEERGPLAIGKDGAYFLRDGTVEGEDPLASFGPHAARHLGARRSSPTCRTSWSSAASIPPPARCPRSKSWSATTAGSADSQREPFLLYPAVFDPGEEEIVGAGHLHDVLKGWIEQEQGPD